MSHVSWSNNYMYSSSVEKWSRRYHPETALHSMGYLRSSYFGKDPFRTIYSNICRFYDQPFWSDSIETSPAFRHFHLFHARSHTHGVAALGQTVLEGCGEHVTFLASEERVVSNFIGNYGNDFFGVIHHPTDKYKTYLRYIGPVGSKGSIKLNLHPTFTFGKLTGISPVDVPHPSLRSSGFKAEPTCTWKETLRSHGWLAHIHMKHTKCILDDFEGRQTRCVYHVTCIS